MLNYKEFFNLLRGGGLPGGRIYTQPGAVRDGLQEATRALFRS